MEPFRNDRLLVPELVAVLLGDLRGRGGLEGAEAHRGPRLAGRAGEDGEELGIYGHEPMLAGAGAATRPAPGAPGQAPSRSWNGAIDRAFPVSSSTSTTAPQSRTSRVAVSIPRGVWNRKRSRMFFGSNPMIPS